MASDGVKIREIKSYLLDMRVSIGDSGLEIQQLALEIALFSLHFQQFSHDLPKLERITAHLILIYRIIPKYRMAIEYTDHQRAEFLELAADIGIGRAQRQLGYPASWATANKWVKAHGVEITVDSLKQRSSEFNDWYETEELLIVAQAGMDRIHEMLVESELDADSLKKVSESFMKFSNTWMLLKGKATTVTETRTVGEMDSEIQKIIDEENAKNAAIEDKIKNEQA